MGWKMISRYRVTRILTIDDDLDTVGLIRMVLKRAGFEVATASRWDEVVERVTTAKDNRQPFDLIILDIMMPDKSGFDIFRSLEKMLDRMPPVIFLSAKYAMEDMIRASDMGAAKYLIKPTTPDKLLESVREVLEQAR
jgi:DNA-binding response OmpR family regulator